MHQPLEPIRRLVVDDPLFRAQGLSFRYEDGTLALSRINLDIAEGDRIALVGPNGAGKTTLIKQLCGLMPPASGDVFYKNKPLEGQHLDRSRLEMGLLFEDPDDQLFGHTLLDDTSLGPRFQGLSKQQAEHAALQALERVSLLDMAYKAPHNLSFGQKKRAALAGLLAIHPEVLFLDEPTANLDPRQKQIFLELLLDFPGTLMCTSHDIVFLYELCERAVVLDHGSVQHDYTIRELASQDQAFPAHGLVSSFLRAVPASGSGHASATPGGGSRRFDHAHERSADAPLVALRDYHYRYPDGTFALRGIDLSIHAGERLSLVGENGAGKTTLLSCMLGLRRGQGEFLFSGRPVTRRLRRALWRKVGMVFQDCADQLFCSSVREEITFGLRQLGYSRSDCLTRLGEALSMVRMEGFEERVPLHMSGGERKRLALACVLAVQPELLILDEPTAGLDPQGQALLLEILHDLDVTLLLVSHDMYFVTELTHRTLVMHKGLILEDMPVHAFLQDERLSNLNGRSAFHRRHSGMDGIQVLQHGHGHVDSHRHLHAHRHEDGKIEHEHFHEHLHLHDHVHPMHGSQTCDHEDDERKEGLPWTGRKH